MPLRNYSLTHAVRLLYAFMTRAGGYLLHVGYFVSRAGLILLREDFLTSRNYPAGCWCDDGCDFARGILCCTTPASRWTPVSFDVAVCPPAIDVVRTLHASGTKLFNECSGHGPDQIAVPSKVTKLEWYCFIVYTNRSETKYVSLSK